MTRLLSLTTLVVLAVASGCSSNVDHASAQKVMTSALAATVAADGQVVNANVTPTSAQVDLTLTNPTGSGSAQIVGAVNKNGTTITSAVDVTFNQWVDPIANLTLNGSLHEAGTFSSAAPIMGDIKLDGALSVSGSVNAAVDFNIDGSYGPTGLNISGQVGGQALSAGISVSTH